MSHIAYIDPTAWTSTVPEGRSGVWEVRRFTVGAEAAEWGKLRSVVTGSTRYVPAGEYTALYRGTTVVMSDTPDERRDHLTFFWQAQQGHVLIAGLGLGCATNVVLASRSVERVTIVEKSQDVLALVGPHMHERHGDRVELVHADIFDWKPPKGAYYNAAWFDIWDNLCTDNLDEMTRLLRRFGRKARWKGCWGREQLLARRRQEHRWGWR